MYRPESTRAKTHFSVVVSHPDHHPAVPVGVVIILLRGAVGVVVVGLPALGDGGRLGRLDGLGGESAVGPWRRHRLLGEALHGVGDAGADGVVRAGHEASRLRVVVAVAAAERLRRRQQRVGGASGGARGSNSRRQIVAERAAVGDALVVDFGVAGVRVIAVQRPVQFGRAVQQSLHEKFLLVVMHVDAAAVEAGVVVVVDVVEGGGGAFLLDGLVEVALAAADAGNDAGTLERRRAFFQLVQVRVGAEVGRRLRRVLLEETTRCGRLRHVEALAARQIRAVGARRLGRTVVVDDAVGRRLWWRRRRVDFVDDGHVDHAAGALERTGAAAVAVAQPVAGRFRGRQLAWQRLRRPRRRLLVLQAAGRAAVSS